jgi:hypothetical protein
VRHVVRSFLSSRCRPAHETSRSFPGWRFFQCFDCPHCAQARILARWLPCRYCHALWKSFVLQNCRFPFKDLFRKLKVPQAIELLQTVDTELSAVALADAELQECKLFCAAESARQKIIACVLAAPVSQAFKMQANSNSSDITTLCSYVCCSSSHAQLKLEQHPSDFFSRWHSPHLDFCQVPSKRSGFDFA